MYREDLSKIMKKKKSQSALFSPPGRWTGNDFLFKGGLGAKPVDACCTLSQTRAQQSDKKSSPHFRVPTAQGKQAKWTKKNPCQGKHREFGNFAKTQGILFAQVVNSLILKVKDIVIFAVKISIFFPEAG